MKKKPTNMKTEPEKREEKKSLIGFIIFLVLVLLIAFYKLFMEYYYGV